jgi:steroid 5-alpha reductase family enzyme
MKIYLATWLLEKSQGQTLTKISKKDRLLSFFHIKQKIKEFVPYVNTGE